MFRKRPVSFKVILSLSIISLLLGSITLIFLQGKAFAGEQTKHTVKTMNMIRMLDLAIRTEQGFTIDNLDLESPLEEHAVKVLADSYDLNQLNIYVPIKANYPENTDETVNFVVCNDSDICFNNDQWFGNVFSDTILIPGYSSVNIRPYLTGLPASQTLSVYALVNADCIQTQPITVFNYADVNIPEETIQFNLEEVDSSTDTDSNGIPDNIKAVISRGELWAANRLVNNNLRTVYVMNLNVPTDTTLIIPSESIEIEIPTLKKLKMEGIIDQKLNNAYLVVTVSNELGAQIDMITENPETKDLSTWVEDTLDKAPGNLNPNSNFLGINLIYFDKDLNLQVLSLPEDLAIRITIKNISSSDWVEARPFSFPITMAETYLTNDPDKESIWTPVVSTTTEQGITFGLQESSIVALFDAGIKLTDIIPDKIPRGMKMDLTLKGIIPVSAAKSVAEASELYEVIIGGAAAEFREGLPKVAITEYTGLNENQMFITAPAIENTGPIPVEIVDKSANGLSFVFPDAITVLNVFNISAKIERGPNAQSKNAEIIIDPAKNQYLPEKGMFLEGDTVTISIKDIDADDQFVGWYSADGMLFSQLPELIVRATSDLNLKARILRRQHTVNIVIEPPDTGLVALNPDGGVYAPGTELELIAEPARGYQFEMWLLPEGRTSTENPIKFIVEEDCTITAKFQIGPAEVSGLTRLSNDKFERDASGKERLVIWAFGGVVRRIEGLNLESDTSLQLVDASTGNDIGSAFAPLEIAEDKTYMDIIVPPYPAYSDTMPAYVDVDLKTSDSTITIPAFRYYHYRRDNFGVYITAFTANLNEGGKFSIFIDQQVLGTIEFPAMGGEESTMYGLVRTVKVMDNPTPSAVASAFGNTLIQGGIYGTPITGTYEVAYYLYEADTLTEPYEPGTPIYSPAKDEKDQPLFNKTVFPYNLDGTPKTDVPVIKITLPTNGMNYNLFRGGITVYGQSSDYDYIENRVIPGVKTAYQSQILSTDIDPVMTENNTGATDKITMRAYSLNSFGIRMQSLLPFDVTSLVRIVNTNGFTISNASGDKTVNISSPKGGLGYVDQIELRNEEKGIDIFVRPKSVAGESEGLLTFKTPKVDTSAITDIIIYLKSQPTVPIIVLENALMYQKTPVRLESWILIPIGLLATTIGFAAGGYSGNNGGPCFIATAAYGTSIAEEIQTLRTLRDEYMLTNTLGTAFVDLYYNVSPPLANWISKHAFFAYLTRCILTPIILLSKLALLFPLQFQATLLLLLCIGIPLYLYKRKQKSQSL
ncbi:MAG TPA: hypothetical protein PLX23_01950 [Candidatus Hydrogenedens sp.]|nr:hypothetical protein [Candidatus Hydrogenedens sp.]